MLKKLVSLVGSLVAAPIGAGCTKGCGPAAQNRQMGGFKANFPVTEEQEREILGGKSLGDRWADLGFHDTLRFRHIDETVEINGYDALTLGDDGEAYTGKFTMRVTLRKGYTGGPPGSATELFVEVNDVRLVGNLPRPTVPPGAKAILPGQVVVRKIKERGLAKVDDRYVIEMPGGQGATVRFQPWPEEYEFAVTVTKDGVPLKIRHEDKSHFFDTAEPGLYEIRVQAIRPSEKEPDRYFFYAYWGKGLSIGGPVHDQDIIWRTSAPGSSPTPEPKR